MKSRYYLSPILLAVLFFFSSCTDWLTTEPAGKVVLNDFWKSGEDVDAVVMTCYRAMVEDACLERLIVYGELRSDNVTLGYSGTGDLAKVNEANILPTNKFANWSSFYNVINYCNTVLYYAPQVKDPNFTQSKLNAKLAEVLTLRALSYFYLVRSFGEVPFVTDATVSDKQNFNLAKSSEDEILDQLEKDLVKAEGWALSSYGEVNSNKGRITKNAVRALLADIYLWRNKYDDCITWCNKIMDSNSFSLIKDEDNPYLEIFGLKNSTESIFELQCNIQDDAQNKAVNNLYGSLSDNFGMGELVVSQYIAENPAVFHYSSGSFDLNKVTDVRRKDYITGKSVNNIYHIFKYPGYKRDEVTLGTTAVSRYTYRSSFLPANWIMYRLTDIMLMKAEALVQKDNLAPALKIVNTTYMRSNPTLTDTLKASDFSTKAEMESLVLLERQRELMFEGKRWFDLMRMARRYGKTDRLVDKVLTKYSDNISEIASKMKDMNSLYFPISESDLNANKSLVQNPYYDINGK